MSRVLASSQAFGSGSGRTRIGLAVFGVITLVAAANSASALRVATPLGPVSSYEYFGFNYGSNIVTSTAVGTLDYSGQPGCIGVCAATTTLGADPSVSVVATEEMYHGDGGGFATAELKYFVQYNNAPGSYAVTVTAHDFLSAVGDNNAAQAYLGVGLSTGNDYNVSSYVLASTDCVHGCRTGFGNYLTPAPIVPTTINLIANTPYVVDLFVTVSPEFDSRVQLTATLDPTFSTSASGGVFTFSPGVTVPAGVPEPAAWAVMLGGLTMLGGALRRGRLAGRIVDV